MLFRSEMGDFYFTVAVNDSSSFCYFEQPLYLNVDNFCDQYFAQEDNLLGYDIDNENIIITEDGSNLSTETYYIFDTTEIDLNLTSSVYFTCSMSAISNSPPYSLSIINGSIPSWMYSSSNDNGIVFYGTPTQAGSYSATTSIMDYYSCSQDLPIKINITS